MGIKQILDIFCWVVLFILYLLMLGGIIISLVIIDIILFIPRLMR
jgi:hypothetical protein